MQERSSRDSTLPTSNSKLMLWSSKRALSKINKTNQVIHKHIRLEVVQQLDLTFFYNPSVATADVICKTRIQTEGHPYNCAAFRLCKCTDLASRTTNGHWQSADSCFPSAVHTLHGKQAPVAECGSTSDQATGSLNSFKHSPSEKTPLHVHVQYFLILPNSTCG